MPSIQGSSGKSLIKSSTLLLFHSNSKACWTHWGALILYNWVRLRSAHAVSLLHCRRQHSLAPVQLHSIFIGSPHSPGHTVEDWVPRLVSQYAGFQMVPGVWLKSAFSCSTKTQYNYKVMYSCTAEWFVPSSKDGMWLPMWHCYIKKKVIQFQLSVLLQTYSYLSTKEKLSLIWPFPETYGVTK